MNRYGLGAAVVLAAGVSVWLFGTALWGQVSVKPVDPPVHSIKITLNKDKAGVCRLESLIPNVAGVYPGDNVVWNVENGCDKTTKATVTIGPFKRVGGGPLPLFTGPEQPEPITVEGKSRKHAVSRVNPDLEKDKELPATYECSVTSSTDPSSPIKCTAHVCNEPPCPPRKSGD